MSCLFLTICLNQLNQFLSELGQKISAVSGEEREGSYLFQRISVLVQRYNAVMLHESFFG